MSNYAKNVSSSNKKGSIIKSAVVGMLLAGRGKGPSKPGMTAEDWENQNTLENLRLAREKEMESHRAGEGRTTISHKEGENRKTISHKSKTRRAEAKTVFENIDARPHLKSYEQGADGQFKIGVNKPARGWKAPSSNPAIGAQLSTVTPANNTKTASSGEPTSTPAPRPSRARTGSAPEYKARPGGPKFPR